MKQEQPQKPKEEKAVGQGLAWIVAALSGIAMWYCLVHLRDPDNGWNAVGVIISGAIFGEALLASDRARRRNEIEKWKFSDAGFRETMDRLGAQEKYEEEKEKKNFQKWAIEFGLLSKQ
jgi:hypothetical protein